MTQLGLGVDAPEPSPGRVRALAMVLAGFRYPGRNGKLTRPQERACEQAARDVLRRLAAEPD